MDDRAEQMRIVFYSASFFKIDGVTLTLRGLISHITKVRGGRVLVLTADEPSDKAIDAFSEDNNGLAGVLRVTGSLVPVPGADYYMGLQLAKEAKAALEEYSPTVVHITNPDIVALWDLKLVNWVLREREDCVVMATLHTDFIEIVNCYCGFGRRLALWFMGSFLRYLYGLCPAVYAPTEFMRRKVSREGWDTQLGVWGRGVDPDLFSPARRSEHLRLQLGLGPNDIAALWLGRVVHEKQPTVWLRAIHKVQREAQIRYDAAVAAGEKEEALPPRIVGVCVGTGEAMGIMQGAEGVTCLGWKAGEELARVVASCDIMVAPSEIETFGRVTLEAMSCGLACVVNRECGEHLVKHEVNGFCVPCGDKDGYVTGLRNLVKDKNKRNKMGVAGRQMALGYSTTEVHEGMLEVYRTCRKKQTREFREHQLKKRGWPLWEVYGVALFCIFEGIKMITGLIALVTEGSDSEVVRLCVKAFRQHLTLLGALLGLNSPAATSSASSSSLAASISPAVSGGANPVGAVLVPPMATQRAGVMPLRRWAVLLTALLVTAAAASVAVGGAVAVKLI